MRDGVMEVTAIINCHNAPKVPKLLERALKSVLKQKFDIPWEVIVVNDGKPIKETIDVAEKYAKKFEKKGIDFTFFGTEEESGYQCRPKNIAIWHAKGEYISFLDYDNEWTPNHLEVLHTALTEGAVWPDFAYGRRKYVIDEGCPRKLTLPGQSEEIELEEGESPLVEWSQKSLSMLGASAMNNFVDTSDFMASRGAFWRLHLTTDMMWNEKWRRFGDWEVITRAAFFAGWVGKAVDEVVQTYHWTGDNIQLTRPAKETPEPERI